VDRLACGRSLVIQLRFIHLLEPFTQNALKHGMRKCASKGSESGHCQLGFGKTVEPGSGMKSPPLTMAHQVGASWRVVSQWALRITQKLLRGFRKSSIGHTMQVTNTSGVKMFKIKQLLVLVCASAALVAHAADTSPSVGSSSWLTQAQKEIKAQNYAAAIQTLEGANQSNSADWNNLLGYAQRKKSPPDLVLAERFYQSALKIDPKHKGALEYYGELLLMNNDLAGAEQMLARLDKACIFSCEEFRDLKEAITRYKNKK
jgi:hypothetical protein